MTEQDVEALGPRIAVFICDYEVRSSWWASLISNKTLQDWAGKYFAWKVGRKFRRWQQSMRNRDMIMEKFAKIAFKDQ